MLCEQIFIDKHQHSERFLMYLQNIEVTVTSVQSNNSVYDTILYNQQLSLKTYLYISVWNDVNYNGVLAINTESYPSYTDYFFNKSFTLNIK